MVYDLIIVGAGVAGLTASIYASRYKINHLLFGLLPGGQGMLANEVENYPGYLSITGPQLMEKILDQAKSYGVLIKQEEVISLEKIAGGFRVVSQKGKYPAKTLILATGASHRHLNVPGEERLSGRGVSYCVTCDIPFFRNKTVVIVGGGDSAVTGALHAAAFAQKVYLIHRRHEFRAEPAWLEKVKEEEKIKLVLSNQVKEIIGENKVEAVVLDQPYQGNRTLKVEGVFVEIGQTPASNLAASLGVELNAQGYIKVNPRMETNIAGVFAAGDVTAIEGGIVFRQFITSAADGARAAASCYEFLRRG
jgi:thioredoxin reductase (NADPH)